jgi:hypothetical protein
MFDPYSRSVDSDPFPAYKVLRDEHPCYWSEAGDCWVITRHADITSCNQNWKVFSSASGNMLDDMPERTGNTLGTTDPPRHDHLRALIQAAFGRHSTEFLKEPIKANASESIDRIIDDGKLDFIADFSSPVTIAVLANMLGIDTGDATAVRKNVVNFLQSDPETRQKTDSQKASFEWLKDYAGAQIADRNVQIAAGQAGGDLITALIEAEIDGEKLRDAEILMTTLTLVMAGLESASSFLAMMALNLARHPESLRQIVADPGLISQSVEESLRFNTSAQRFRRTLTRDFELHGELMKAGDKVLLCYGAGNRDEREFPDPDSYDIHRRPKRHLGLGTGKHLCIGAPVARMLSQLAIGTFVSRIPNFRLADEELQWIASCTFRSPLRLPLEF